MVTKTLFCTFLLWLSTQSLAIADEPQCEPQNHIHFHILRTFSDAVADGRAGVRINNSSASYLYKAMTKSEVEEKVSPGDSMLGEVSTVTVTRKTGENLSCEKKVFSGDSYATYTCYMNFEDVRAGLTAPIN